MPNYHVVRIAATKEIVSIATTSARGTLLLDKWSEFAPTTAFEMHAFDTAAFSQAPKLRTFQMITTVDDLGDPDTATFDLFVDVTSVPRDRQIGVPHIDEKDDGSLFIDLFLRGGDYDNIFQLGEAGRQIIEDAIEAYFVDSSAPFEQSMPTEFLVMDFLTKAPSPQRTITNTIDHMGSNFGFTQAETFIALAKLATADQVHLKGNSIDLIEGTPANYTQDQSSSFDGEVIF